MNSIDSLRFIVQLYASSAAASEDLITSRRASEIAALSLSAVSSRCVVAELHAKLLSMSFDSLNLTALAPSSLGAGDMSHALFGMRS